MWHQYQIPFSHTLGIIAEKKRLKWCKSQSSVGNYTKRVFSEFNRMVRHMNRDCDYMAKPVQDRARQNSCIEGDFTLYLRNYWLRNWKLLGEWIGFLTDKATKGLLILKQKALHVYTYWQYGMIPDGYKREENMELEKNSRVVMGREVVECGLDQNPLCACMKLSQDRNSFIDVSPKHSDHCFSSLVEKNWSCDMSFEC